MCEGFGGILENGRGTTLFQYNRRSLWQRWVSVKLPYVCSRALKLCHATFGKRSSEGRGCMVVGLVGLLGAATTELAEDKYALIKALGSQDGAGFLTGATLRPVLILSER